MVPSHRACGFAAGAALFPVYGSDCLSSLPPTPPGGGEATRVAAEMNSAALGRPWPLFQPTCRPVGPFSSPVASQAPRHIGIIMDGNGRWARRRGRPASFGHRAGVRAIKRALQACEDLGVHTLSIYAFSTENWARPRAEVRALMRLFHETMQREIDEMYRGRAPGQQLSPVAGRLRRDAGH